MREFKVYLNKKHIDSLFYSDSSDVTSHDVKDSLINHDGYDSGISVKEVK